MSRFLDRHVEDRHVEIPARREPRSRRWLGALGATALMLGAGVVLGLGPAASPATAAAGSSDVTPSVPASDPASVTPPGSESFAYDDQAQTFTVPVGVTSLQLTGWGGSGGAGGYTTTEQYAAPGGLGAEISESVGVTPGEQLTVQVGGKGGTAGAQTAGAGGGSSGGGETGGPGGDVYAVTTEGAAGGGGGGGTLVTSDDSTLLDAAGGGGGGGGGASEGLPSEASIGGAGGNASPSTTFSDPTWINGEAGSGSCAGAGGGYAASSGPAGTGGEIESAGPGGTGGGGGGGVQGGTGGGAAQPEIIICGGGGGGGGGSSSHWGAATDVVESNGLPGNGGVTISWPSLAQSMPHQETYSYDDSTTQYFTVPSGVSSLHLVATGGGGGPGAARSLEDDYSARGGSGAEISETVPVTPTSTLVVELGQPGGGGGEDVTGGSGGAGGLSSGSSRTGGAGGNRNSIFDAGLPGGGGGGATEIVDHTASSTDILLVAGGGGGSGGAGYGIGYDGGQGGDAGTPITDYKASGSPGYAGSGIGDGVGGLASTVTARGGLIGSGGTGSGETPGSEGGTGGGGGGGYIGGTGGDAGTYGGGGGGGGGAGSSLVDAGDAVVSNAFPLDPTSLQISWADPAYRLVFSTQPPSIVAPGASFTVAVSVEDETGDLEAGDTTTTVTLAVTPAGAGLSCSTDPVTVTSGVADFSCLVANAGTTYRLTATANSLAGLFSSYFDVTAAAPAALAFSTEPPSSVAAGSSFTVAVSVESSSGNVLADDSSTTVSLSLTPSAGGLSCTPNTAVTVTGGVADFSCEVATAGDGYKLIATGADLTMTSTTFDVMTATPAELAFSTQPPATTTAGTLFPVAVSVENSTGNLLTTDGTTSVSLSITAEGTGAFSCTTSPVTAADGVADFSCEVTKTGDTYTLTATATSLTPATSAPFDVMSGAPAKLAFSTQPPGEAAAGSPFTVAVSVEDEWGDLVTYDGTTSVSLAIASSVAGFSCTSDPVVVTDGMAMFTCTMTTAGDGYTLEATATPLTSATSDPFDVAAGTPAKLVFSTEPPATTSAGASFVVAVSVQNSSGNFLTFDDETSVSLSITRRGTGALSCATDPLTVTHGMAVFSCEVTRAGGTYDLTAAARRLTSAKSSTFDVTAGTPAKLAFSAEPPPTTRAGAAFRVAVSVEDAWGNLVTTDETTPVTLAITAHTGSPGAAIACTSDPATVARGVARFTCSVDEAGNGYTLTAESAGLASATSSRFWVKAPPPPPPAHTRTTIRVTPASTVQGSIVTYSTTVTSARGSPSGTVVFKVGSIRLCTAALRSGSGHCTASDAPVGFDVVTGTYGGAAGFEGSSGTVVLVVRARTAP